jgi:hypothetical protein
MGILDKYNKRIGVGSPLQGSINTGIIYDPSSPQQLTLDLEGKYDNAIGVNTPLQGNINTGLIFDPSAPQQIPQDKVTDFNKTSLDLENPQPLGGPINVPYTTKVGSEIKTSPTTQPYTPKNTYTDSFTDPRLIARTIDPYK